MLTRFGLRKVVGPAMLLPPTANRYTLRILHAYLIANGHMGPNRTLVNATSFAVSKCGKLNEVGFTDRRWDTLVVGLNEGPERLSATTPRYAHQMAFTWSW